MSGPIHGQSINIRPGVSVLAILPHLNYKPWYAIAEFVDNSLQSYLSYHEQINRVEMRASRLEVRIHYDANDDRITIRDNAAGIHAADYPRAFRPAAIPVDRSGLSEFGMGMKSAACWFARKWTVRTKALGEDVERTVHFDIEKIVRDELEELEVAVLPEDAQKHYTEIVLTNLHHPLKGRTLGKVKEHLGSIYRMFIREGSLLLQFDNEVAGYDEPKILHTPYFKDLSGPSRLWHKNLDIDLGLGLKATGFAALRETASTSSAGFALFRRRRLIVGSGDESYRPSQIFGASNSYTYQRLFGEIELEGFEVSHTKDGFRWQEYEEIFLDLLKEELNASPIPLLSQAEGYRARLHVKDLRHGAEVAANRTAEMMERELPQVYPRLLGRPPDNTLPPNTLRDETVASRRVIEIDFQGLHWEIDIELSADPAVGNWIELADQEIKANPREGITRRQVSMRLSLMHPFMERFAGNDPARIEPLLRVAAGIMLSEIAARSGGAKQVGTIRRNLNELLRDALAKP